MRVILREDVEHLGRRGQIVKVAAGYGRNFLLPRGLAVRISSGSLQQIEHEKKIIQLQRNKETAAAEEIRDKIAAIDLTFKRKVGDSETLYGSVTNADVAEALMEHGFEVDKRKVLLDDPIKELGNYSVQIRLENDVKAKVKIYVVTDDS